MPINKAHADTYLDKMNNSGMELACCPCCGDTGIDWFYVRSIFEITLANATVTVKCNKCKGTWTRNVGKPYRILQGN